MDSIKDMKCPACGRSEKFEIEIGTTLVVYNSDDELTWKAGSDCQCGDEDCYFNGTVADFMVETATEPAKHTPGPWHWHEAARYIFALDGTRHDQVAEIETASRSDAEAKANARHIVLAVNCHDELLAACKAAREATRLAVGRGGNSLDTALLDALESTIAKAEGRTSC